MPGGLAALLAIAALLVAAQAMDPIRTIVASTFMALNLVIVVWPIQKALSRVIPRILASIVAGIAAIAILIALVLSLGWTIAQLVSELTSTRAQTYLSKFQSMVEEVVDFAQRHNVDVDTVMTEAVTQIQQNLSTLTSYLAGLLSNITSAIGVMTMIVLILIFMIIDSADFSDRMTRLSQRHNFTLAWALTSFAHGTRRYWVVATVFGLIVALCNWVLLLILGVPLAVVWAMWSFVTNYIPNIGFVLGIVPPAIMALVANSPVTALWVIIGYCVFNVLIQTVIQPRFTGGAVGITTTVAVLSLFLWAYVLGPLGTILAIPATLLLKTLFIDIDPKLRWVNAFIASNPTTSDEDPMKLSAILERAKAMRKATKRRRRHGGGDATPTSPITPYAPADDEMPTSAAPVGQPRSVVTPTWPDDPLDSGGR